MIVFGVSTLIISLILDLCNGFRWLTCGATLEGHSGAVVLFELNHNYQVLLWAICRNSGLDNCGLWRLYRRWTKRVEARTSSCEYFQQNYAYADASDDSRAFLMWHRSSVPESAAHLKGF